LPCHIAGLKSFLSGEYERLITCDFICGGVASPLFFREHLKYLEKKNSSFVVDINFRAKLLGWREHSLLIEFENGHKYKMSGEADSFFSGYFKKVYQRDSCYACRYRLNHMSDVIIADYWGGAGSTDNNAGMSMVIGNSKKGNDFFREVLMEESHAFEEMPADNTSYAFKTETERYMAAYPQKSKFYDTYNQYGFETAARKTYLSNYKKLYLKWIIKRLLRKYR
jgi:coenzyme F420-reducing hydrogenase beta subunit